MNATEEPFLIRIENGPWPKIVKIEPKCYVLPKNIAKKFLTPSTLPFQNYCLQTSKFQHEISMEGKGKKFWNFHRLHLAGYYDWEFFFNFWFTFSQFFSCWNFKSRFWPLLGNALCLVLHLLFIPIVVN